MPTADAFRGISAVGKCHLRSAGNGFSNAFALLLAIFMTHVSSSFSMVVSLGPTPSSQPSLSEALDLPTVRLSMASSRVNGVYKARDPKSIPRGFVRMCSKAGGFAPRPIWDDLTNGITPWFESKDGCYMYFNCNDSHWWIDDSTGAGMYLAVPDGSLLLPPTHGWISLTGRRVGAPVMSFI